MTLAEAKKELEKFVRLKTTQRPAFVDVLLAAKEGRPGCWIPVTVCSVYECSVCHAGIMTGQIEGYKFCQNCGASMEVKE